jgi:hypothetical protein
VSFEHSVEETRSSKRFPGVFRPGGFFHPDIQPGVVGLTLLLQFFGDCWWLAVVICVVCLYVWFPSYLYLLSTNYSFTRSRAHSRSLSFSLPLLLPLSLSVPLSLSFCPSLCLCFYSTTTTILLLYYSLRCIRWHRPPWVNSPENAKGDRRFLSRQLQGVRGVAACD